MGDGLAFQHDIWRALLYECWNDERFSEKTKEEPKNSTQDTVALSNSLSLQHGNAKTKGSHLITDRKNKLGGYLSFRSRFYL